MFFCSLLCAVGGWDEEEKKEEESFLAPKRRPDHREGGATGNKRRYDDIDAALDRGKVCPTMCACMYDNAPVYMLCI